jgi:hypothetical protein
MKIGEVYFVGERDRSTGELTPNVKIGMVGDEGGSVRRLKEHQTGNPRDLVLQHVIQTPAPFWLENALHQRLSAVRIRNEWHRLTTVEMSDAIALAESLSKETFDHYPFINEQRRLKGMISNGEIATPTEESSDWHQRLCKAHTQLSQIDTLTSTYKSVISELDKEDLEQAEEEDLVLIEHYASGTFDVDGFNQKYPKIIEEFTMSQSEVSGTLSPKYIKFQISEIDPELESFSKTFIDLCSAVSNKTSTFSELSELFAEVQYRENVLNWEKDIAVAHLASICGANSGIEGQITWNRSEKVKTKVDLDALETAYSKEFSEFYSVVMKTRQKRRKRARRQVND